MRASRATFLQRGWIMISSKPRRWAMPSSTLPLPFLGSRDVEALPLETADCLRSCRVGLDGPVTRSGNCVIQLRHVVELCLLTVRLILDVKPVMQDERAHQRVRVFGETEVCAEEQALSFFQRFSRTQRSGISRPAPAYRSFRGRRLPTPMRMSPGRGVADRSVARLPARRGTTGLSV